MALPTNRISFIEDCYALYEQKKFRVALSVLHDESLAEDADRKGGLYTVLSVCVSIVTRLFVQLLPQQSHRLFGAKIHTPVAHGALSGCRCLPVFYHDIVRRTILCAQPAADTFCRIDLQLICIARRLVIEPQSLSE